MIKTDLLGEQVGQLGFGAMRLPVVDQNQGHIDQAKLDQMIDAALAGGINYFDTAYPYHACMSEVALTRSLSRYPRESYLLATKYPGHQVSETYDPKATFEEQLEKCQVDYFDFYLLHNVYEGSVNVYTNEKWGIVEYLIEQKRNGRIKHLGFSAHARPETLAEFLDFGAHIYAQLEENDPETAALFVGNNIMEFCQIQLNYLDWTLQKAADKCALLEDAGIPVIVMEPLRGGKLADLPKEQTAKLAKANATRSAVEWSFRWLQDIPNVKVILSGMSNMQQLEQNLLIFQDRDPLASEEVALLMDIAETLKSGVPCTGCRYCVDSCPQNIDIPLMMSTFNDMQYQSSMTVSMQMDAVPAGQRAQDCIACGSCAQMCPQGIDIPTVLAELADALDKMPKWADSSKQRELEAVAAKAAGWKLP